MAAVTTLALLLVALICGVPGEEIRVKGDVYTFRPPKEANFCVISRSAGEEENLVLWNTSDPSPENRTLPEDLKERLLEVRDEKNTSSYGIHNLTLSDSGLYREECWTDGNVTHQWNTSIIVCSVEQSNDLEVQWSMVIPCGTKRGPLGDNRTAQWFREHNRTESWTRLFVDDHGSLNPLMKHLEGRVQLVENSSSLGINNVTNKGETRYACLVMDKQQCVSSNRKSFGVEIKYIVHAVGVEAALPCFDTHLYGPPAGWLSSSTLPDRLTFDRFFPAPSQNHSAVNLSDPRKQYRYSEHDPVVSDDYSLVFSPLTLNHTGEYYCDSDQHIAAYSLKVCPESDPVARLFSDGEEVTLGCRAGDAGETGFRRFVWVRRNEREKSFILYPSFLGVVTKGNAELYEGLKGRLKVSPRGGETVVLSNLSPEDGGEYWCLPVGEVCKLAARIVLVYRHPFGVASAFYAAWASLMTCGLLGMVCAVVAVNVILKTRRGERVPP